MKYVFLSHKSHPHLKDFLKSLGKIIIQIKDQDQVYKQISDHPDIYLCVIDNNLIVAKEQIVNILNQIKNNLEYINIISGSKPVGSKYPNSAIYNGIQIGTFFIHNTKYTDNSILKTAHKSNLQMIDIKQAYANCNIVAVDNSSIITSDIGISKIISKNYPEIDVLQVSQGHVILYGFEYGFLGGASGRVDEYIVFNGNLEEHPDFIIIKKFIESKNLKLKYFKQYPLTDIGSIIGL